MYRFATRRCFGLVMLSALSVMTAGPAIAQLPTTRIYSLFPQGAQAGTSIDVTVTNGADLDELQQLIFNHPGITAEHKTGNTFAVKVDAGVPVGIYEARANGLYGTSNPRCFVVGSLPEINEDNNNASMELAKPAAINTVINGKSDAAADVDFYRVPAKKGQRLLIECSALRIDSRFSGEISLYNSSGRRLSRAIAKFNRHDPLLDITIPADGDYFIRAADFLYGGSADHGYRLTIHTGPHIDYVLPPVGIAGTKSRYTLVGRNLPGGQPAGTASDGRDLQKLEVDITLPNTPETLGSGRVLFDREAAIDGIAYVYSGPNGASNPVIIGFASSVPAPETEPNDEPAGSQKITVPADIAGTFSKRSDLDRYEFDAKAGQVFWVDVTAQQLGSTADPYLVIDQVTKKEDGTETLTRRAAVDDTAVNAVDANLFNTNHDDVSYRFAVPADATYRITLRDRYFEARGYDDLFYHLAIREEVPDFRLLVIPPAPLQNVAAGYQTWSLCLRRGDNLHVQVAAVRRHGFNGTIDISAQGLPAGVTCKGASIGPGQNNATLIFTAAETLQPVVQQPVKIIGAGRIEDSSTVKAVTDLEKALTAAVAALPKLSTALQATVDPKNKAEAARKVADKKAVDDAAIVKTATDAKSAADKTLADAQAAQKVATDAKTAADAAVTEANKGTDDAAKKAAQEKATGAAQTLTQATQATQKATAEQQKANQTLTQATAVLAKSTAAQKVAVAAHDKALAAFNKATTASADGEANATGKKTELATARQARDAAAKNVTREARSATVVWNGTAQQETVARLTHGLSVSVMAESAPYQVTTEVYKEVLNHNRQLLIPVKLTKRNGFDNKITLNVQNLPKNAQFAKQDIEKGKDSALLRLFVPPNVAEGTYTLFVQCQGQVSYQRNPARVDRAKKAQDDAVKVLAMATEAAKKATTGATAAAKSLTDATAAQKATETALTAARKKLTDAQAAEKKAAATRAATDTAVTAAQTAATQAQKAIDEAKKAAEADKENSDLAKAVTTAETAGKTASQTLTAATTAQATATKGLTAAQAATKAATATIANSEKTNTEALAKVKTATDAKSKADAMKAAADAAQKTATTDKANVDKEHKAATDAAKAKNINYFPPSTPNVVTVRKAAFTLATVVAGGGNLKRGAKLEVKVTVNRINGFTGPVTVNLGLPPGSEGLSATPVTIPADQKEATLVVNAAGNATEGAIQYAVVHGTADWDGPTSADQPVTIKVAK
ncbi:MAG: hypothetical protein VB858_12675 [Planctomycetaceae bacterium]